MISLGLSFVLISIQACVVQCVNVEISPRRTVVLPQQNISIMCQVGIPIHSCRFSIPGKRSLNLNPKIPTTDGVSYYGAGLQAGQCGAIIHTVSDQNNGNVNCSLGFETEAHESVNSMELTVAKPPKPPHLDISRGHDQLGVYKVDEIIEASCIVREGRPAANISWYLDEEQITEGVLMPIIHNIADGSDLYTVLQNITRRLRVSDNGKQLRCVAEHPALRNRDNQVSRQLDIKYPPQPQSSNSVERFGFEMNKAGIIEVDIYANPKPIVQWSVGDQSIREGNVDSTGRLEAEQLREEGRGHYIATLRIASITKQDTETKFKLIAYNDQGSTDYYIVISTSPEPEGLQLDVIYIVLIVIAVLALLFVVFLLIFARSTGRWCFSGIARRHPTESSDTESADVRHQESKMKIPKLQFSAVFKKNKDKVSHEDDMAKTMDEDE